MGEPPLAWRGAGYDDRGALKAFICTDPPKRRFIQGKRVHPREYELDAQSGIKDLEPPYGEGSRLLLGHDSIGLAAVAMYQFELELDETSKRLIFDAFIKVVAVAWRIPRRSGRGREAMDQVLAEIEARARVEGADEYFVAAHVHEENTGSLGMCQAVGFIQSNSADDDGLETWSQRVAL